MNILSDMKTQLWDTPKKHRGRRKNRLKKKEGLEKEIRRNNLI